MVKDLFNPFEVGTWKGTSFSQHLSDVFTGTNYGGMHQAMNDYNLQKAVNMNKYQWNSEGMRAAGINPIIASGNLSNISASQAAAPTESGGFLVQEIIDLAKTLAPSTIINDLKDLGKSLLKK